MVARAVLNASIWAQLQAAMKMKGMDQYQVFCEESFDRLDDLLKTMVAE